MEKTPNYLHHGSPQLRSVINKMQSIAIFIVKKEYHQTSTKKIPLIKEKFMKADYPLRFINSSVKVNKSVYVV